MERNYETSAERKELRTKINNCKKIEIVNTNSLSEVKKIINEFSEGAFKVMYHLSAKRIDGWSTCVFETEEFIFQGKCSDKTGWVLRKLYK